MNSSATDSPHLQCWEIDNRSLREPDWIWPQWLPRGGLTVLATPSGGNFQGVVADLVARVTAGSPFPRLDRPADSAKPPGGQRVAVVTAGGDSSLEFGRLVGKAGGRLDLLRFCSGVIDSADPTDDMIERPLSLPADFTLLKQWVLEGPAPRAEPASKRPPVDVPVALLVIEAFPRQVAKWRESELRTLLDRLSRFAIAHHLAILLVTPLTVLPERLTAEKVTLARAFGSSMLVETATALWHIDENPSHPGQFDLIPHKLSGRAPALRYSMEGERITWQVSDDDDSRSTPKPTRTTDRPAVPAVPPSAPIPSVSPPVTMPLSAGGSRPKPLDSRGEQFRNSPEWKRASRQERKRLKRRANSAKSERVRHDFAGTPSGADDSG